MRIIAGAWRGRRLAAPAGDTTRPTADRVRQSLFDMIMHAAWGGRALLDGATVLDAFAGSGALGLEALSRGAAHATFFDVSAAARAVLRANVAACGAGDLCDVRAADTLLPPPATAPFSLIFLDPPYGQGLPERAAAALQRAGWIGPETIVIVESGREDILALSGETLADRSHGAARLTVWRPLRTEGSRSADR